MCMCACRAIGRNPPFYSERMIVFEAHRMFDQLSRLSERSRARRSADTPPRLPLFRHPRAPRHPHPPRMFTSTGVVVVVVC